MIIISGIILKLGFMKQGRKKGVGKEGCLLDIELAEDMHPPVLYRHIRYGIDTTRLGMDIEIIQKKIKALLSVTAPNRG